MPATDDPGVALIVFDLDGTLVDSRRDLADAANRLLVESGGQPLDEVSIGRMVGDGAPVLVRRAFAAAGVAPRPDGLARFLEIYDARLLEHTRPYPGIPQALERLARSALLAVLTNKPQAASARILRGLTLDRYFFQIMGGDGPFSRKPAPDGLHALRRQAGAPADQTVLVGDSMIDLEAARAAGVAICLCRYGFGYLGFPEDRLRGDELLVDDPKELERLVERHPARSST